MDTHINADNVCAHMGFPHLTKCKGETTYSDMEIIKREIYQNLMAIPSHYVAVTKVHLGILIPDAIYFQRIGGNFVIPDDPGDVAAFPVVAMDRQRKIAWAQHKAYKKTFETCKAVIQACRIM